MTDPNPFDPVETPLEGTNLIEAGAGTGKTYAITGLYVRLLLERHLAVRQILVVTYTEAATEELKDRIRRKIRDAATAFSLGRSEDAFLQKLVERHGSSPKALENLREALRAFDEAAIFTIHGFCRRMLQENAFESGCLFDTALLVDPGALIRECVDDFWRKHCTTASPLFVTYALAQGFNPAALVSLLELKRNRPLVKVVPHPEEPNTEPEERRFREAFSRARDSWRVCGSEVADLLASCEGLHKGQYAPLKVRTWSVEMDDLFEFGENGPGLFPNFTKFTCSGLEAGLRKGFLPPEHPYFGLCDDLRNASRDLEAAFRSRLLALKAKLFEEVDGALTERKAERNVQTFDDLLLKLHAALQGKGGSGLSAAVGRTYKAALIDEFQDTDPVQYAIFERLFGQGRSILFLVGDPKQSIYGFRGADVFAYMEAAEKVRFHHTLVENWRSEPRLVDAVNALFSNADPPFVYEKLAFNPAVAARRGATERLTVGGEATPPFTLWFMDPEDWSPEGGVIGKGVAQERLPGLVAGEIARLLDRGARGKAAVGTRRLRANDIAVLVRQNRQALLMQKALAAKGVPSVLFSMDNLFDAREAEDVERFLAAVVDPNHEPRLKAALSSPMLGMGGEDLERLMLDQAMWETWLLKFRGYHDLWQARGFIRMFRVFLREERVLSRLIAFADGERRVTNVLHLMEVLHQVSVERDLNMTGLLTWLSEQRDPEAIRSEEHQLRLESDEHAVHVVTIHKSKGLEYNLVFCPFCWEGIRPRKDHEPLVFHDPENRMQLVLDLGSEERGVSRTLAEREELAENLRLFYVALTRARCGVNLVWGRFNGSETSAPGYLLHPLPKGHGHDVVKALSEHFSRLTNEDLLSGARTLARSPAVRLEVVGMDRGEGKRFTPSAETVDLHPPKRFSGSIDREWKLASFSSLVSDRAHGGEEADHDRFTASADSVADTENLGGVFAFPKGTKAGVFFHDLFEHLDFSAPPAPSRQEVVREKLAQYGYDPSWMGSVCETVENVLHAPLDPDRASFRFAGIGMADRLNELEFTFPLKPLAPDVLRKLSGGGAGGNTPEFIERLRFSPVRGFMRGFMDMVFRYEGRYYLVDWKSNFLGSRPEDYGPSSLATAMEENGYVLQYMIYVLALNRYLGLRIRDYAYETHFGGVLYVFLRGVDPSRGPEYGIYRARPPREVIESLSEELMEDSPRLTRASNAGKRPIAPDPSKNRDASR